MFLIFTKELKTNFQNRKWNSLNRKWNYFSHFDYFEAYDKKRIFQKILLFFFQGVQN